MIRGHTDAAPWSAGSGTNNWRLSVERAEVSRQYLAFRGIASYRFSRIEGVADREPYVPSNRLDRARAEMHLLLRTRVRSDRAIGHRADEQDGRIARQCVAQGSGGGGS